MTKGELYIVSTGIGKKEHLTCNAIKLLEKADLIVGYKKYINDIQDLIKDKEIYSTGMTEEVNRCKRVVKEALNGKNVALISNGDVNVYGMAGLVLEIIDENNLWNEIEVIIEPGITTLLAAAAKTGAPIMNDFAVISLSNLLTPIDIIKKRLIKSIEADFVIGIYNPLSHTRKEPYMMFLDILKQYSKPEIPVVIAQNLGRDSEKIYIKNVGELLNIEDNLEIVNMSTVLILGNSTTRVVDSDKRLITKRGYQKVYDYQLN